MAGAWSNSPLVCLQACSVLTMPTNGGSCTKTIVNDPFTVASELLLYTILPPVPAAVATNFFGTSAGGRCLCVDVHVHLHVLFWRV